MVKRTLLLLLLAAMLFAGCTPPATPQPDPTPTPAPPQPVDTSGSGGFAPYVPVVVNLALAAPAYVPDLGAIANGDMLSRLSQAQRETLEENGFVVVPRPYQQIYEIYQQADEQSMPAFVTTDAVLHAYHILYDYALRLVEIEHFIGDLEALNAALLQAAQEDYETTSGPMQEAAWQNLAFFAVAAKLLDADAEVPAAVRDAVEKELALIDKHQGFQASPIFDHYRTVDGTPPCKYDYCEDYSQYVPRGHYTRNADFERYFRTMMWYGRMSFHLSVIHEPPVALRETRSAMLIVRALYTTTCFSIDVYHGTTAGIRAPAGGK